ncbi:hypothetical protein DMN91_002917 [Ooceraea biroi]|uniref:Uncharacterized protein n=1 Tax=Ooceraea biroi TaxID=2015173 RepID=A0A3L8DWK9_OOCBI|nr:hypothetical protein DMN91_002917 [Ooceraea biroi]
MKGKRKPFGHCATVHTAQFLFWNRLAYGNEKRQPRRGEFSRAGEFFEYCEPTIRVWKRSYASARPWCRAADANTCDVSV